MARGRKLEGISGYFSPGNVRFLSRWWQKVILSTLVVLFVRSSVRSANPDPLRRDLRALAVVNSIAAVVAWRRRALPGGLAGAILPLLALGQVVVPILLLVGSRRTRALYSRYRPVAALCRFCTHRVRVPSGFSILQ